MDGVQWRRWKSRWAAAIALVLPACTDRDVAGEDGAGDGDGSSGAGSRTGSSTSPETATGGGDTHGETTHVDDGGEGVRFDLGDDDGGDDVHFDLGVWPDVALPTTCDRMPELVEDACGVTMLDAAHALVAVCLDPTVRGACPDEDAETMLYGCGPGCWSVGELCGPVDVGASSCCYWTVMEEGFCPGRPLLVDGRERLAEAVARDDWGTGFDVECPTPSLRVALARAWTEDALCEHAAIASFARFVLQLLAVGAPADLVARAQQAATDELAHARAFFGIASAYAGAPIGPAPLDVSGVLGQPEDLVAIAVATVREGCIAETISLVQLATAAARVRDPVLHATLTEIVEQEAEHVELAWSFVAWAMARGDHRLRAAVREAFAEMASAIPRGPDVEPGDEDAAAWSAHGRLTKRERLAIARATLRHMIEPTVARLLASARVQEAACHAV